MASKTALGYVLDDDGKLVDAFIQSTGADDPEPTQIEKEIVRIVGEHKELQDELKEQKHTITALDMSFHNWQPAGWKEYHRLKATLNTKDKQIEELRKTVERANEEYKSERHKRCVAEQALKAPTASGPEIINNK